jgi:dihydrofolate reductase
MISIIVAIADNFAIGKNNQLLWHLPGDLKRFKKITLGHTVIMGKKTYDSLPSRPLKNRRNIVITDVPGETKPGCEMAYSFQDAINKCDYFEENFIIGGASVYRQFLPYADRLYLTRVNRSFNADVFFPEINFKEWTLVLKEDPPPEEQQEFNFWYEIYDRNR